MSWPAIIWIAIYIGCAMHPNRESENARSLITAAATISATMAICCHELMEYWKTRK